MPHDSPTHDPDDAAFPRLDDAQIAVLEPFATARHLQDGESLFQAGDRSAAADESDGNRPPLLLETSVPGVFAAGDVRSGSTKRVASSVGEGSMAIMLVHEYLAWQNRVP